MKKKILFILLMIPVIFFVLEVSGVLCKSITSVNINSGTFRRTNYICGIKVSEVKRESDIKEYFEQGKEENWKTYSSFSGVILTKRGSGTYSGVGYILDGLLIIWEDSNYTEKEKCDQLKKIANYWNNDEPFKASEYFNSLSAATYD